MGQIKSSIPEDLSLVRKRIEKQAIKESGCFWQPDSFIILQ